MPFGQLGLRVKMYLGYSLARDFECARHPQCICSSNYVVFNQNRESEIYSTIDINPALATKRPYIPGQALIYATVPRFRGRIPCRVYALTPYFPSKGPVLFLHSGFLKCCSRLYKKIVYNRS